MGSIEWVVVPGPPLSPPERWADYYAAEDEEEVDEDEAEEDEEL